MVWDSDGIFEIFVHSLGEGASEPNVRLTMARRFGGPFFVKTESGRAIVESGCQTLCSPSGPRSD